MIDWQTGSWTKNNSVDKKTESAGREKRGKGGGWRMTIASDWAPMNEYGPVMLKDSKAVYGELLEKFHKSDINVVNIETVLGDEGEPIKKAGPNIKGDPKSVAALNEANFHIGCLANNHIMDFGKQGLVNTQKVLRQAGIKTVGAGVDTNEIEKPVIQKIEKNGSVIKAGIINCAEGESGRSIYGRPGVFGLDVYKISSQIKNLKQSGEADVVVVIFHGGREHITAPPPYVVHNLRQIASAGADAIIGHHPHVPQGVEIYEGVPIAYSQGNFVFWTRREPIYNNIGYLVHLDFQSNELCGLSLTPYKLTPAGLETLNEKHQQWFYKKMARISKILENDEDIHAIWAAFADRLGWEGATASVQNLIDNLQDENKRQSYAAKLKNFFLTPAHSKMYFEIFDRLDTGELGKAPTWARQLVDQWQETTDWAVMDN